MFAVSYDEPDALEAYAAEYGVTFPLLSDPDSEIIERFGILNTLSNPTTTRGMASPSPAAT